MTPTDLMFVNLVFDFDGTLIREDMGSKFHEWVDSRHSPTTRSFKTLASPLALLNLGTRMIERSMVVNRLLIGVNQVELTGLANQFLDEHQHHFSPNDHLMRLLEENAGRSTVLTGSPTQLVLGYLERLGLADIKVRGLEPSRFGWWFPRHPYGRTKKRFVRDLVPFIAFADSWSDRHLLKKAAQATVIERDIKLKKLAVKNGWSVLD